MVSFLDLPLDIVALISIAGTFGIRAKVGGWLALCRTCQRFSALAYGVQRRVILSGLIIRNVDFRGGVYWGIGGTLYYEYKRCHRDAIGPNGEDLPAIIYKNGGKAWIQHGEFHRDRDLPAYIWSDGSKEWFRHGKRHRDTIPQVALAGASESLGPDGDYLPAIIWASGNKEWWVNGKKI